MSQKKKLWIGILIGVIISVITLGALLVIFLLFFLYGGPKQITEEVALYEETMGQYSNVQTGFITFPEEISDNATNVEFYFSYQDTWDDPTCEVFLQCIYEEEEYLTELHRLENACKIYGATRRELVRDEEERFPYPAYIAINGNNHAYEYALLSGEREITYIYTSFTSEQDLKKIDAGYLPADYDTHMNQLGFGEGYNIYIVKMDEHLGEIQGYQTDYTRDELVEVNEYHPVTIGYNWFTVCTRLDEEDNEIIEYCAYMYYDNRHDSLYGYPEEIQYGELAGYRFKSVELNDDKTLATVTYYDDEEEKTMEYEIPEM